MRNCVLFSIGTALLAAAPAKAQTFAFDNTSNYQNLTSDRGTIEIGDEVNLTTGPATMTEFVFEYLYTGTDTGSATVQVRFYDKTGNAGTTPGNVLFQTVPFTIQSGFNAVNITGMSVPVPGRLIWTADFEGLSGPQPNAGLLFYNGVSVGDGPGQSRDDHWENLGTPIAPNWALINTAGVVDNFGARITVIPEHGTSAVVAGLALAGFAAIRRYKNNLAQ
jgi:hypothetical protein